MGASQVEMPLTPQRVRVSCPLSGFLSKHPALAFLCRQSPLPWCGKGELELLVAHLYILVPLPEGTQLSLDWPSDSQSLISLGFYIQKRHLAFML